MIVTQTVFFVCLLCLSAADVNLDDFCSCQGKQCDCDHRAYMQALEADFETRLQDWEVEKEEWLQEIQSEKEVWTTELEEKERLLDARVQGAGAGDAAAATTFGVAGNETASEQRARLAAELRAELLFLQFPEADRCDVTPQLHFNFRQMGLGAAWHGLTLALTSGYVTRRAVVIDPQPLRWVWGDRKNCGQRTMSCWFEPLTNCRAIISGPHQDIDYSQRDDEYKAQNTEFDWWAAAKKEHQSELSVFLKNNVWGRGNDFVPTKYRALGLLWWRAQLLAFVMRPTAATRAAIDAARNALTLDAHRPYIGMHVRRGAKWKESPFVPLATYVEAARRHVARAVADGKPAPKAIYLATDAVDVVEELTNTYGDEFTWLYRAETHRHPEKNVTWMNELQRRWKAAEVDAVDVIRDVWLLAEADYVVCTFSSNIGRVVTELRYAWTNQAPGSDVFSVDKNNRWLVDP